MRYLILCSLLLGLTGCNETRDTNKVTTEDRHTDESWTTTTTKHTAGVQGGNPVDVTETTDVEHKGQKQLTAEKKENEHTTIKVELPPELKDGLSAITRLAATLGGGAIPGGSYIGAIAKNLFTPDGAAGLAAVTATAVGVRAVRKKKKLQAETGTK